VNLAMDHLSSRRPAGKSVAAVLILLLFLALQVFSASDSLHRRNHSDAASSTHQCAVTLISQGHLEQPALDFRPAVPTDFVVVTAIYNSPAIPARDYRFADSRGPPSLL
jgi:hypothetical protein